MEIKNLNEYKFILSTGCSYGLIPHVAINPFDNCFPNHTFPEEFKQKHVDTENKIISLGLNIGSQGSDWQADSIIHLCTKILELGVKPENIYCLVEWSQWNRMNIHPYHYINLDLEKFNFRNWNSFNFNQLNENKSLVKVYDKNQNELLNKLFAELNVTCSNNLYNVGKIENRIYVNPMHMNKNDFLKLGDEFGYLIDVSKEMESNYMFENKIKNYLNNILRVQYFLDSKNLKYNFLFMQSTLSDWYNLGNGIIKHELNMPHGSYQYMSNDKIVTNEIFNNRANNPNLDIEVVMPETKLELDKINFNNIWFHESEKFRRGGIDEWTLENLKEVGYIKLNVGINFSSKFEILCNYNHHPNHIAYLNLWNLVSTNCDFMKVNQNFLNYMNEKYWEDYNYDGFTKNNITMSKKEWHRINEQ